MIPQQLKAVGSALYARAQANRAARTFAASTMDEVMDIAAKESGYIKTMWCGSEACEDMMKETVSYTHLDVYKRQAVHCSVPLSAPNRQLSQLLQAACSLRPCLLYTSRCV